MRKTFDPARPRGKEASPQAPRPAPPYRTPVVTPIHVDAAEPPAGSALAEEVVIGALLAIPAMAGLAGHHFGAVETTCSLAAAFVWKELVLRLLAARRGPFATPAGHLSCAGRG